MIFLIGISFVSAVKTETVNYNFDQGLVIEVPLISFIKSSEDHNFVFQVYNSTTGVTFTNSTINCSLGIIADNGSYIFQQSKVGYTSGKWQVNVLGSNFTDYHYHYGIKCITSDGTAGGVSPNEIFVTEDSIELTEGRSMLIIGLIGLLVFFLFIGLYSLFSIENYIGKFALYWVNHILIILITFASWQVGVEGLLGGIALTGIFRIMFYISTIAIFPMLLLSIAYIFYIHTYNEHFEKLIKKGEDPESAFRIMDKKNKRRKW